MPEPAKPLTVLLIEDNPGDARLAREAFLEAGQGEFELVHAPDLLTGLMRLDSGGIDVVLSDLNLPDSEGLGAVARLRAHAKGIPILVLTGTYDEARGLEAVRHGVQDYLLKEEMTPRPLVRAVRYAIERKRTEKALSEANRDLGQANRELAASREELEHRVEMRTAELAQANRDLETLFYVAAHDLKEPLNAILSFSDSLMKQYSNCLDAKGQDFLQRISRGTGRMRRLLEDLLVMTRTQRIEIPEETVAADEFVTEALSRFQDRIRETGAKVTVEKPLPKIRAHRTWAIEAIANLISNALKFTLPGKPPEIEIARFEGGGLVVRDRGPGVNPEITERIFQLFQRGVGREVEGTGAGLAIVRQIAERHGGHAWVQPREGGGSEFVITFGGQERLEDNAEILLVDDDEDFVFIMKESLATSGLIEHVAVAHDGVEAIKYLRKQEGYKGSPTPDIVLLDINMPRKNGFEVLAEMRGDSDLNRIPVAMVTSSVRKEDEARAISLGASAYLSKPFQIDDLLGVVRRLVR